MLWRLFTEKATQRRLQLLFWLEKKTISFAELAQKTGYSIKTLQRDLKALQSDYQLQFLIKEKVVWQDRKKYPLVYQRLFRDSWRFCLFEHFLWCKKIDHPVSRYQIEDLNQFLEPLGVWLDCKNECLAGNQRVIFQLRLQHVKDFTTYQSSQQRYQYFLSQKTPVYFSRDYLKDVANDPCFFQFLNDFTFTMQEGIAFYQDHQLQIAGHTLFYQHQKLQSPCYQKMLRLVDSLARYITFSEEQSAACQRLCFKFLLGLETGLPLAYIRLVVLPSDQPRPRFASQLAKELRHFNFVPPTESELFQSILFDLVAKIVPVAFTEKKWRIGLLLNSSLTEQQRVKQQLLQGFSLIGDLELFLLSTDQHFPSYLDAIILEDHFVHDLQTDAPVFHFKEATLAELFIFLWQLIQS